MAQPPGVSRDPAIFRLERFEWAAPDRLEVVGRFAGLRSPIADATLTVQGAGEERHLSGALLRGTGADGEPWAAAFAWTEPPIAFETAVLQIGDRAAMSLPAPHAVVDGREPLDIVVRDPQSESGSPPADRDAPRTADALRLQAEVLAAQDEARLAETARRRLEADLIRAREDLKSEHAREAEDSERYRQGLARVQEVGEAALAEAQSEIAALQDRVAQLDAERQAEVARLRAELERAGREAADLRAELETAHAAGSDVQRLRGRLQSILDGAVEDVP